MSTIHVAYDFFGNQIHVGDTVAALGTHYKELFLYKVTSISAQKVRVEMISKTGYVEPEITSKFHSQCIVKPNSLKE